MSRLVLLLLAVLASGAARAETLVVSLSSERIPITSNFTGAELALFGSIERDATSVSRASAYDVVVTVRGPRGQVMVREKKAMGPFWLNRDQRRYIAIPAFISILANRPLDKIGDEERRRKLMLGIDPLVPAQGSRGAVYDIDEPEFRQALMRLRREQGLFHEAGGAVSFLTPNLFRAAIRIPGIAPLGRYDVDVTLLSEGAPLAKSTLAFTVVKGGVEQRIASASRDFPILYGVATSLMALLLGWLATVIFRRD